MKLTNENMTPAACQANDNYGLDSHLLNLPPHAAPSLNAYEPDYEDIKEFYDLLSFGLWRMVLVDYKPKRLEFSAKFLQMIGLEGEAYRPSGMDDFISKFVHPDDWAGVSAPFIRCFESQDLKLTFEHRLLNQSNGQWRWVKSIIRSKKHDSLSSEAVILGATMDVHLLYQLVSELNQRQDKADQDRARFLPGAFNPKVSLAESLLFQKKRGGY